MSDLTLLHMAEVISREITFGSACSAKAHKVKSKAITYQPTTEIIRIYADDNLIATGKSAIKMIEQYNSISIR